MPVTQSSKPSQTVTPVQLLLTDFSGGLNADMANHPLALAENELADILNYKYVKTPKGVKVKSRDGLTKKSTAGAFPAAIKDVFFYTAPSGITYIMAVSDSDLNYWIGTSTGYTKVGDLSSARGRMCQFDNKLVIADGKALKTWYGQGSLWMVNDVTLTLNVPLYDNITSVADVDTDLGLENGTNTRVGQHVGALNFCVAGVSGSANCALMKTKFKVKKVGTVTGTLKCSAVTAGGALTSSDTFVVASLDTSFYTDVEFDFSYLYAVGPTTDIYVYLWIDGVAGNNASNYVKVACSNSTTLATGVAATYAGSTWSDQAYDCISSVHSNLPPYADFVVQKQDRIYCNDNRNPNYLFYCNANDILDFASEDGGGYIVFDGHYKINGLAVWYDEIYVFCDYPKAVYRLTGDSPTEYVVKKLFTDVTANTQDVIQNVGVDLLFLDNAAGLVSLKTMIQYRDIEKAIVSHKVRNTYIAPYFSSQVTGKNEQDNQLLLTTTSNYLIVYDVELGIWTRYQFNLGTGVTPTAFFYGWTGLLWIGASDGHLYYMDYSTDQDNSTDFSLELKTPWHDLGTIQVKTARFADSLLISSNQETYDLEIYTDFNEATAKKTLSMVSLSKNGAFHSPYCGNINEVSMRFNQIQMKLTNVTSSTGPHWLDRIIVEANITSSYT